MSDSRPKRTNEDLWEFLEKISKDTESCKLQLDTALQAVKQLEEKVDEKISTVTKRQDSLEKKSCTKDELQAVANVLKNDMKEENERYLRKNNVVVFGLTEDANGRHLYSRLMKIIGDHIPTEPQTARIGHPKNSNRPLRVYLPAGAKGELMSKLVRLKDLEEFKTINVKHDLTKLQREAKARSPVRTRSKSAKEADKVTNSGERKSTDRPKNVRKLGEGSSPEPVESSAKKAKMASPEGEEESEGMETLD